MDNTILQGICLSAAALSLMLSGQEGTLENGTIQFRNNTLDLFAEAVSMPVNGQAAVAEISRFKIIQDRGFQFTLSVQCETVITLQEERSVLFNGSLKAGTHRIFWKKLPSLKKGRHRILFQFGPSLEQEQSFGQRGFVTFRNPSGIRFGNGRLYVQDSEQDKGGRSVPVIYTLDPSGKEKRLFLKGYALGDLDHEGRIWAVSGKTLACHAPDGKLLKKRNSPGGSLSIAGKRMFQRAVNGKIYIADGPDAIFTDQSPFRAKLLPVHGKVPSPAMAADNGGVYLADCGSRGQCYGALCKAVFADGVLRNAYPCPTRFKDLLAPVTGNRNQVYALERGTVSAESAKWKTGNPALLEFFDSGAGLFLVRRWEIPALKGVRALAVSGNRLYILEDTEEYRGIRGNGRLSCFQLNFVKEQSITFQY